VQIAEKKGSRFRAKWTIRPPGRLRWPSRKRQSSVKTKAAKKNLREQNNGSAASAQSRGRPPALEKAKREHDEKVSGIETERAAIDRRSEAEVSRWEKKEKLEGALRRAHT